MKPLVAKLSGFAKFELDHKLSKQQFIKCMFTIIGNGEAFSQEKNDTICASFTKAYKDGTPPFAGDLENETYKAILQSFKDFDPASE